MVFTATNNTPGEKMALGLVQGWLALINTSNNGDNEIRAGNIVLKGRVNNDHIQQTVFHQKLCFLFYLSEKFEDTKGVIRSRNLKNKHYNDQRFEDTKGVIRSRNLKNRHYNGQRFEDTKGVIRSRNLKNRHYNGQRFEDTKGVIRSRNLKNRHYNGQSEKRQTTIIKTLHKN